MSEIAICFFSLFLWILNSSKDLIGYNLMKRHSFVIFGQNVPGKKLHFMQFYAPCPQHYKPDYAICLRSFKRYEHLFGSNITFRTVCATSGFPDSLKINRNLWLFSPWIAIKNLKIPCTRAFPYMYAIYNLKGFDKFRF